jgi:AbrB family looped-hinge helix DNA binding protein
VTGETFIGQIIADGRVTIPDKIRELLGLKEGDYVQITVEPKSSRLKEA